MPENVTSGNAYMELQEFTRKLNKLIGTNDWIPASHADIVNPSKASNQIDTKMGKKIDRYSAHTVILPSYAPVFIGVTYEVALRLCESSYGKDWKNKSIRIEKTTREHIKIIAGV
ncbi:hypothetical protein bas02_0027 [Veterinaerplatzvirus Jeanpiccard]|uniref:Uncharacterized protein n=1 Tax=Escherichia phage JeanPiccard TaxID=2851955 RepID=A0AAE7VUQ7_9CAUD|nr:hypothetical protein bas02_0027 [Escherichia phage JeanPiccard]